MGCEELVCVDVQHQFYGAIVGSIVHGSLLSQYFVYFWELLLERPPSLRFCQLESLQKFSRNPLVESIE